MVHPILLYLIKANALLLFFWLFYRIFIRKETFYTTVRWYFVFSMLFSLIAPLLTYTKTVVIYQNITEIGFNNGNFLGEEQTFDTIVQPSFWETVDWQLWLLLTILSVSAFFILRTVYQIVSLYLDIKKLPCLKGNPNIKITKNQKNIYSFYRWIVVPERKLLSPNLNMILAHENIHLNQKHTLDLLFIEIVSAVFWFNPSIKWLQKDLNANLEFIVDEKMVANYEPVTYQKCLLEEQTSRLPSYINTFSTNDLKRRIIQLNTKKSNHMKKVKILLTAPVLVAFFVLFQVETVAQIQTEEVKEQDEKSIVVHHKVYNADEVRSDRSLYEELIANHIITIDDEPQTKEQLEKFDHTKIEYMHLAINHYTSGTVYGYNLSTKPLEQVSSHIDRLIDEKRTEEAALKNIKEKSLAKSNTNSYFYEKEGIEKLSIYNRWGNLIAQATENFEDLEIENLPDGVYYYVAINNGQRSSGSFTTGDYKNPIQNKEDISTTTIDENGIHFENPPTRMDFTIKDMLIILDGKEISEDLFNDIAPTKIKSITFLNQAEQVKPYGKKGENGVVVIKTKKDNHDKIKKEYLEQARQAEVLRKEALEKREEAIENRQQLIEERKKRIQEKQALKAEKESLAGTNFDEKVDLLRTTFSNLKSLKDEFENEKVKITHLSAEISYPKDGVKMKISENY